MQHGEYGPYYMLLRVNMHVKPVISRYPGVEDFLAALCVFEACVAAHYGLLCCGVKLVVIAVLRGLDTYTVLSS